MSQGILHYDCQIQMKDIHCSCQIHQQFLGMSHVHHHSFLILQSYDLVPTPCSIQKCSDSGMSPWSWWVAALGLQCR